MAHKTGAGSTKNLRDSNSKSLGLKCCNGQFVNSGNILIRQLGLTIKPGINVSAGKDYTLYATCAGIVYIEHGNLINILDTKKENYIYI